MKPEQSPAAKDMQEMTEPEPSPERPVLYEFSDWEFRPVEPVGWTATHTTGSGHIHVVAAPTIRELRVKLREVRGRKARP